MQSSTRLLPLLLASCLAISANAGLNQWTSVGPNPDDRLNVKNFVVDPSNPDTIYATTTSPLGLWRSRDRGVSWESLSAPDLPQQLAVDALNPNHILFLGLFGLYQSFDGSATWSERQPAAGLLCGNIIHFDGSADWKTIYVAGTPGGDFCSGAAVARSTDGGRNWTRAGLDNEVIHLLKVDPTDPTIVYATAINNNEMEGRLFRTRDGGRNWVRVGPAVTRSSSLVITPTNPSTLYLSTSAGLWTSRGGEEWTLLRSNAPCTEMVPLAVDPSDPAVLFAATPGRITFQCPVTCPPPPPPCPPNAPVCPPAPPPCPPLPPCPTPTPPSSDDLFGVIRSTDYGLTWSRLIEPALPESNSALRLIIDPRRTSFYQIGGSVVGSTSVFEYTIVPSRRHAVRR